MHFQPVEEMVEEAYTSRPQEEPQVDSGANDVLDDVFGSGPSSPTERDESSATHPSDIRRLQTEHTTAGYREGVTISKESSIQAGFDEGFSLGASVGLRAGQILGMLEAITEAVRSRNDADSTEVAKLTKQAQEELSTQGLFTAEYWAEDGNWKYDVKAAAAAGTEEVLFADVADAHPLVKKWTAVVEEQVALWKIDRRLLDDETGVRLESVMDETLGSGAAPAAKKPLDW